jgi:hypothetical protein
LALKDLAEALVDRLIKKLGDVDKNEAVIGFNYLKSVLTG